MVKVGVLGYGTVGSGTVELLLNNREVIAARIGQEIEVKYILELRTPPEVSYKEKFTADFNDILNDPEVTVVAEAIGGINPVYGFIKSALEAGKHVVTANKELVAEKGGELLAIAKANKVKFLFEASVGGGIPIIRPLHQCLAGNNILFAAGILNGTSNFILSKMTAEGSSFEAALKKAQALGYAEADPSADVDGIDTCRKICIIASMITQKHVYPSKVYTEGIRNITSELIQVANDSGYAIKLIGRAKPVGDSLEISVAPMAIPKTEMIAGVNQAYNAMEFVGDYVGKVFLNGLGAGKEATASAVVSDIIEAAQRGKCPSALGWENTPAEKIVAVRDMLSTKLVIATDSSDRILEVMPDAKILSSGVATVFLTPLLCESELDGLLGGLDGVKTSIRVLKD